MPSDRTYHIRPVLNGQTLAAGLRGLDSDLSWNDARKLVQQRRIQINGNLVLDDTRRLKTGDVVKIFEQPRTPPPAERDVPVLHIDQDLIVIDKPAGITTLRHAEEKEWDDARKQRQPTLDEVVQRLLPTVWPPKATQPDSNRPQKNTDPPGVMRRPGGRPVGLPAIGLPKVRAVHRLDRDTSGLMLFALSPRGETALVKLFKEHSIRRVYRAVVHGLVTQEQTIESWFVRDRGDGIRGSSPKGQAASDGQHAETYVRPIEALGRYTIVECRLKTGRTHQIRIHLAEAGHMLCGEKTYLRPKPEADAVHDKSGAPRQALHSASLELEHPFSGKTLQFESPMARDLETWLKKIRTT
ncbi:RluA family pseudouridine synthase [Humisphaera borealis]|uniref:RluA family pseudouridine synthase n=1 Tax=Humisphaera borealis TaxID=2807512 RepID=A0A7M2WYQ3_9BACT|nr:RluA family pseudouridine synthase [Humisphaera borealis]QOV90533.1 RluA family pseudouridine synthase [Humisphaera borealis]